MIAGFEPATVRVGAEVEIAYLARRAVLPAPTFVLAHATGFCAQVWRPVIAAVLELDTSVGFIAVDQRAHGRSDTSPHPFDWWDIGRDLVAVVRSETPDRPVVGVGHSGGGAGCVLAALESPGSFDALVLIDPIITPPPHRRGEDTPLAIRAERRRRWFADADEAARRWRRAFDSWDEEAFAGYVEGGLVPGVDEATGERGLVLACDPHDEAEWFRAGWGHGAWERLHELDIPVRLVTGRESETHGHGLAEALAGRIPGSELSLVDGEGHFLPMERPRLVAAEMLAWADRLSR